MKHRRTDRFIEAFERLPESVQRRACRAFRLFEENMSHPSLRIEQIEGAPGIWSGRISRKYRWTFQFEDDCETGVRTCVHRVIGPHDDVYRAP